MSDKPLVSIVTAAYNAALTLPETAASVLSQKHGNWEWIVVNDGSTDNTRTILESFDDPRIKVIHQANTGVSKARNRAIEHATGAYLCFVDADDVLTPESLTSRLEVFALDPAVEFVDGCTEIFDHQTGKVVATFKPGTKGKVMDALLKIDPSCFFGPTWMIKRKPDKTYRFKEGLSHAEDLLFYISIAHSGVYDFTDAVIYRYRSGLPSAMGNLRGLEMGYKSVAEALESLAGVTAKQRKAFRQKAQKIMLRSYLKAGKYSDALRLIFSI